MDLAWISDFCRDGHKLHNQIFWVQALVPTIMKNDQQVSVMEFESSILVTAPIRQINPSTNYVHPITSRCFRCYQTRSSSFQNMPIFSFCDTVLLRCLSARCFMKYSILSKVINKLVTCIFSTII